MCLRNELVDTQGQLFHANNLIRKLAVSTTPPFSTPSTPHPLAPSHPLVPRPPSSPSPSSTSSSYPSSSSPSSSSASSSTPLPTFLNPVPYSLTIQILECNSDLYREYFHHRVPAPDSNLGIVADYHHWLDITKYLPPNHHDHHHPWC